MSTLTFGIDSISDSTRRIMQAAIAANEQSQKLTEDGLGPLALANALSDFFQIASILENGIQHLDHEQMAEFAEYGIDLLDRLAYQLRQLEILEQRENMARVYASISVWFARRDAVLENLEGVADSFAWVVNGLTERAELAKICHLMSEVIGAASEKLVMDEDRSNPWRPWRVLNLNAGIAATRSLDPQLMEQTFDILGHNLPYDMPGFIADGKRQMITQNVPDEIREVMDRYAKKWPASPPH